MTRYRYILVFILLSLAVYALSASFGERAWDFDVIKSKADEASILSAAHLRCTVYKYCYSSWGREVPKSSCGALQYTYSFDLSSIDRQTHRLQYSDADTKEEKAFVASANSISIFFPTNHGSRMVTIFGAHVEPAFQVVRALFVVDTSHEQYQGVATPAERTDVESDFGECVVWRN